MERRPQRSTRSVTRFPYTTLFRAAGTFRVVVVAVRDVGADYPDFPHLAVRAPVLRRWIDDGDALVRQRRAVAYDERRRFARSWRLRLSRREPGRAEIGRAHV